MHIAMWCLNWSHDGCLVERVVNTPSCKRLKRCLQLCHTAPWHSPPLPPMWRCVCRYSYAAVPRRLTVPLATLVAREPSLAECVLMGWSKDGKHIGAFDSHVPV